MPQGLQQKHSEFVIRVRCDPDLFFVEHALLPMSIKVSLKNDVVRASN